MPELNKEIVNAIKPKKLYNSMCEIDVISMFIDELNLFLR